jgi:hypothetical protein
MWLWLVIVIVIAFIISVTLMIYTIIYTWEHIHPIPYRFYEWYKPLDYNIVGGVVHVNTQFYKRDPIMINGKKLLIVRGRGCCLSCGAFVRREYRYVLYKGTIKCYPCYCRQDVNNAYYKIYLVLRLLASKFMYFDLSNKIFSIIMDLPRIEKLYVSGTLASVMNTPYYPYMLQIPTLPIPWVVITDDYDTTDTTKTLKWEVDVWQSPNHMDQWRCTLTNTYYKSADENIKFSSIKEALIYVDNKIKTIKI